MDTILPPINIYSIFPSAECKNMNLLIPYCNDFKEMFWHFWESSVLPLNTLHDPLLLVAFNVTFDAFVNTLNSLKPLSNDGTNWSLYLLRSSVIDMFFREPRFKIIIPHEDLSRGSWSRKLFRPADMAKLDPLCKTICPPLPSICPTLPFICFPLPAVSFRLPTATLCIFEW